MIILREWEKTLPKALMEKSLSKIDKLELDDNQTKTQYKKFHYGLDKILFKKFYHSPPSFGFSWLNHSLFPILDHMLFINKNCVISYPYHIKNDQLTHLLKLVHDNGFKLEIDEFASHYAYSVRVIIYR